MASLIAVALTPVAAHAAPRAPGGLACTIVGTERSDVLKGTSKKDVICGRGGNDVIKGGAGNDVIDGGSGKDRLSGGTGKDRIFGSHGNDVLSGGTGADRLEGGEGSDRLQGGADKDIIKGGDGSDRLDGGTGNDQLLAGRGQDRVSGGAGNDYLAGGADTDRIDGGSGADRVAGESGNDVLTGASGDDDLAGGPGNDTVTGVAGDDILSGGPGTDRVDGGSGFNLCDVPDPGDHQVRCAIDEDAPVVGDVVPSPSVVDVSAAAKVVRVSAHVTDDTGVKSVQISAGMATLVSGTPRDGVWQASIQVPRFTAPGPRSLFVNARDRVGRARLDTRDNIYTVINGVIDREMPVMTSFSLSTDRVDVRAGAQPVTATVTVTDDLAGPKDVWLCLTRPTSDGGGYGQVGGCNWMTRQSGGPQNSTWRGSATVPQGSVSGTWNMEVWMSDAADNNLANDFWLGPQAFALVADRNEPRYRPIPGGAGALTVVGVEPDPQAPVLTSVTLSPSTVDTSHGAVRVTATISGTDDEGISGARLIISGRPSGASPGTFPWVDVALATDFRLVSGSARNGTWQTTFVVPGGTPDGAYWIQAGLSDRSHSPSWVSPGTGWESAGTLDSTPLPSTTHFVVANAP